MTEPSGATGRLTFEAWWSLASQEFGVDPRAPVRGSKASAWNGWHARDAEIDALTAERDRLRMAFERIARGFERGVTTERGRRAAQEIRAALAT